jgi:hypothetical protein
MPTITIPDSVQIAYDDSGPVPNSDDYTTLVILHGSLFHNCRPCFIIYGEFKLTHIQ